MCLRRLLVLCLLASAHALNVYSGPDRRRHTHGLQESDSHKRHIHSILGKHASLHKKSHIEKRADDNDGLADGATGTADSNEEDPQGHLMKRVDDLSKLVEDLTKRMGAMGGPPSDQTQAEGDAPGLPDEGFAEGASDSSDESYAANGMQARAQSDDDGGYAPPDADQDDNDSGYMERRKDSLDPEREQDSEGPEGINWDRRDVADADEDEAARVRAFERRHDIEPDPVD